MTNWSLTGWATRNRRCSFLSAIPTPPIIEYSRPRPAPLFRNIKALRATLARGRKGGLRHWRTYKANKSCEGCGKLKTHDFESFIFGEMAKKMSQFESLIGGNEDRVDPRITALQIELAKVDEEIEKLLDTLSGANPILLSYANSKIEALDTKRQNLVKEIADLSAEVMSPRQIRELSNHIHNWENISFEDRRKVVDGLITQIRATSEYVQIEWKI